MRVVILGSAAGGGVPQWNCRCGVCALAWDGDPRVRARTQSSVAVSLDGASWLLINASPDIRQQITAIPALQPRQRPRGTPLHALLVTNGDIDHVAGLLSLRERQALILYGTAETLDVIGSNPIFNALDMVERKKVAVDQSFEPLASLRAELFVVSGKVPLWLEQDGVDPGREGGGTVGLVLEAQGRRVAYVPGCAAVGDALLRRIEGSDLLLFDGTVWHDDDLIAAGVSNKTGRRMGHMPIAGADGSMAALAHVSIGRRVFTHINNTNPILVESSPQRLAVEAAGWTVAHDGLVLEL